MSLDEVKHSTLTSGEMSNLLDQVFKDAPDLSFIAEEKPTEKKLRRSSTVGDYFDTTLEKEVYDEVKGFQSRLTSHSILSDIEETVLYQELITSKSTVGENTVRFDKALLEESLSQNDSFDTVIFNGTSQDHSTDSWLVDEMKNDTVEEAEDSRKSKEDDEEITLEDTFLQWPTLPYYVIIIRNIK